MMKIHANLTFILKMCFFKNNNNIVAVIIIIIIS